LSAIVVPLGIWAMVLVFILAILHAVNDGVQWLRRLHQIPCFRCQYYTQILYAPLMRVQKLPSVAPTTNQQLVYRPLHALKIGFKREESA
jgi:hypothetical protein